MIYLNKHYMKTVDLLRENLDRFAVDGQLSIIVLDFAFVRSMSGVMLEHVDLQLQKLCANLASICYRSTSNCQWGYDRISWTLLLLWRKWHNASSWAKLRQLFICHVRVICPLRDEAKHRFLDKWYDFSKRRGSDISAALAAGPMEQSKIRSKEEDDQVILSAVHGESVVSQRKIFDRKAKHSHSGIPTLEIR